MRCSLYNIVVSMDIYLFSLQQQFPMKLWFMENIYSKEQNATNMSNFFLCIMIYVERGSTFGRMEGKEINTEICHACFGC